MMNNKYLMIFLFTILLAGFAFSTPVVTIYDPQQNEVEYSNNTSLIFKVEVSNLGGDCEVGVSSINIDISSDQTPSFSFPLYCNLSRNYSGNFSISFTESDNSPPVPLILVDSEDTVVFSHSGESASLVVDTVRPIVGNFDFNAQDAFLNNYYKGNVILNNISSFSDNHSGIKKYVAYIVEITDLNGYKTDYTKKIETQETDFEGTISLSLPTGVDDGNYYVLLDVVDQLDNSGLENSVKDNKKVIYSDNSPPEITSFNLGDFQDSQTYYVTSDVEILEIVIDDPGVGIKNLPLHTQLDRNDVKLVDFNSTSSSFYFDFSEVDFNISGYYEIALTDLLDNFSLNSFNIVVDQTSPIVPTKPTLALNVDNNVTISNWGTSTDSESGLKEYNVYRSTSSFTTVTNQTLICTVSSTATKSCVDSSSKSSNTRYYYGVSAIDNASNESDVVVESVVTGPELSITIDSDYSNYVSTLTPKIDLSYSSDVNAVRFSCNGSTFTSWVDVSGSSTSYDTFNITSGNGCNTDQGEKTIYVEAKSENEPYSVTRKSKTIRYDSLAPTVPTNVVATQQSNGSIKVSWSSSTDEVSGVDGYRVYYSEYSSVSEDSLFFTTSSTEYIYSPNLDQNFYFKVSSLDNISNESSLSSVVTASARRFGPSFTFNISPKNVIDGNVYVKAGNALITIISTQILKQTPTVRLKIGEGSFQNLSSNYDNLVTTVTHNFQETGDAILEVTGINNNNESSTDQFSFYTDSQAPVLDVNYSVDENIGVFLFEINNYSEDIFRVQYLLNNQEEICFIENSDVNYQCSLNSVLYEDGEYVMNVVAYDSALNFTNKEVDFEIDNVDEDLVLKNNLINEIYENIKIIEDRIVFLNSISFKISQDILDKLLFGKQKLDEAKVLDDTNFISDALNTYTAANNSLLEALSLLPKETIVKTKTQNIDIKNVDYDLNSIILDQNLFLSNYEFHNLDINFLDIDREFSVFEISGQHYYSSTLEFRNSSDKEEIISYIEFIPKEFSKLAKNIYFDKNVVVIDEDPIILYNLVIPANSSISTRYISKQPITSFDVLTKYDAVVYKNPLILTGFVGKDDIILSSSSFDTKLLFLIAVVLLIIIVILLVIWLVASSGKKKEEAFTNIGAKDSMNKYLGDKLDNKSENRSTLESKQDNSKENELETKNKFKNNYEFILDAVKRNNK